MMRLAKLERALGYTLIFGLRLTNGLCADFCTRVLKLDGMILMILLSFDMLDALGFTRDD